MRKQNTPLGAFVFEKKGRLHLVFRDTPSSNKLSVAESKNGTDFTIQKKTLTLAHGKRVFESWPNSRDFHISQSENGYFLSFIKDSAVYESETHFAFSQNGMHWQLLGESDTEHPCVLIETQDQKNKTFVTYTASGRKYITCATSRDGESWEEFGVVLGTRTRMFDASFIHPVSASFHRGAILLLYTAKNGYGRLTLGASIFHPSRPNVVLWRTDIPLWEEPYEWNGTPTKVLGGANLGKYFFLFVDRGGKIESTPVVQYWERPYQKRIITEALPKPLPKKSSKNKTTKKKSLASRTLHRHEPPSLIPDLLLSRATLNPILSPCQENAWESVGVFNPTALRMGDTTHLIYRAIGESGESLFGYASSKDGFLVDERHPHPIYINQSAKKSAQTPPIYSPVLYPSGGSWGGFEDPRAVEIEGRVYVTFTLFEDWLLRVGLMSLSTEDFLAKNFHKWDGPHILSHGNRDKNWVLFPEKINGKFAILHSILGDHENEVRIEYIKDITKLSQRKFESPDPQRFSHKKIAWHTRVRSAGPPPIKTQHGWLLFYHAHDHESDRYKVGAMILDLTDPTKILARAQTPVLCPDFPYENDGKPGVVYASGVVIHNGELRLYYGGADKVSCVATASLEPFMKAILEHKPFSLKKVTVRKPRKNSPTKKESKKSHTS